MRLTRATSQVSFSSLGLRIIEASTGIKVRLSSIEPAIAKALVNAIGLNILPSRPSSENSGRNTKMMMVMAKAIGLERYFAAASTAAVRRSEKHRVGEE